MTYKISNQNLIVATSCGKNESGGHCQAQRHYPIFVDDAGVEYISLNGQVLQKLADLKLENTRRETANRG